MKRQLMRHAAMLGLFAGVALPGVTCNSAGLDGLYYDAFGGYGGAYDGYVYEDYYYDDYYYDDYYYEDVYYEDVYYEDPYSYDYGCCDDGWGFDLWFDWGP